MTTFQIVRIYPIHHFSTDAVIGNGAERLPMTYCSEALAHKLAGRLHDADYNAGGDDIYRVVTTGASPFGGAGPRVFGITDSDPFAEIPF